MHKVKPLIADIIQVGTPAGVDTGLSLATKMEHWTGVLVHVAAFVFTVLIGLKKLRKNGDKNNE